MNGIKKNYIVVLTIYMTFFVLGSAGFVYLQAKPDDETVVRAFRASGAEFSSLTINGWKYIGDEECLSDPVKYFEHRLKKINSSISAWSCQVSQNNGCTTITAAGTIEPKLTATVTLIQDIYKPNKDIDSCLVLSLESKDPKISYQKMTNIFDNFMGKNNNQSMVASGYIDHELSARDKDIVLNGMIRETHAQNVERLVNGQLESVAGYSPDVRERLTLDGKWVNINMALRYNALENKTMVYVGSPVITSEY